MPLIPIVVTLIVVGVLLWLVGMIPMDATILKVIRILVIICVVLWILSIFLGGWGSLDAIRVGHRP